MNNTWVLEYNFVKTIAVKTRFLLAKFGHFFRLDFTLRCSKLLFTRKVNYRRSQIMAKFQNLVRNGFICLKSAGEIITEANDAIRAT